MPPGEMSGRCCRAMGMEGMEAMDMEGRVATGIWGIMEARPAGRGAMPLKALVSTMLMSSPEHCSTSMGRFLLPKIMGRRFRFTTVIRAASSESSWMKASPDGSP